MSRVAFVVLSFFLLAGAAQVPTPKEQCEHLLDAVLPLAEKLLQEHGEYFPFGATLKADGSEALVSAYEGTEHPPSQPLIDMLRHGFRTAASKREIVATAIAYDVRVVPPGKRDKTDAVLVELDHRDGYSVIVYFPYVVVNGTVTFGEAFANAGKKLIFANGG